MQSYYDYANEINICMNVLSSRDVLDVLDLVELRPLLNRIN